MARWKFIYLLLTLLGGVACLALGFWKCRYGLELFDEPLALAPAFKLMTAGDNPFAIDVLHTVGAHDLMNFYFIQPWAPYSLLTYRSLAFGLYAGALLMAAGLLSSLELSLSFILAVAFLLVADFGGAPTFSGPFWVGTLLLVHNSLVLFAPRTHLANRKGIFFCAGLMAAGVVAALHAALLAFLSGWLVWYLAARRWGKGGGDARPYLIGAGLGTLVLSLMVLSPSFFLGWVEMVRRLPKLYSGWHLESWPRLILSSLPFLFILAACWIPVQRLQRIFKNERQVYLSGMGICAVLVGLPILYSLFQGPLAARATLARATLALVLASAFLLIVKIRIDRSTSILFTLTISLGVLATSLLSPGADLAMLGAVAPCLLLPVLAPLTRPTLPGGRFAKASLTMFLLVLLASSLFFKYRWAYGGALRADCSVELVSPPFAGVRVPVSQATQILTLRSLLGITDWVASEPPVPLLYLIGDARSPLPTLGNKKQHYSDPGFLLREMVRLDRAPEKLLHFSRLEMPAGPLADYFQCLKKERPTRADGFQMWNIPPTVSQACLK